MLAYSPILLSSAAENAAKKEKQKIKILIVEDEKPIADLLDMSLTAAGYSCDCLDKS